MAAEWINIIVSAFVALFGAIGGGIGIFYYRENKKLHAEEARAKEIENELKEAEAWKELAEKYEAKCEQKSQEKAELYKQIDNLRSDKRQLEKDKMHLEFELEKSNWNKCIRNGCMKRKPRRNYGDDTYDPDKDEIDIMAV